MRVAYLLPLLLLAGCKVVMGDEPQASVPVIRTRTVVVQAPADPAETTGARAQQMAAPDNRVIHSAIVGSWNTSGASPGQISVIFSSTGQFNMSARGNAATGTFTVTNGTATATYQYKGKTPEGGVEQGTATFQMTPDGTQLTMTSADPTMGSATLSKTSL